MKAQDIRKALEEAGVKLPAEESLHQHVKHCDKCVVGADGDVWYCWYGARIAQRERKATFFP